MKLRTMLPLKALYLIVFFLVFTFVILIGSTVIRDATQPETVLPSPTPVRIPDNEGTSDEVPLVITINPTYVEKIRKEPFWTKLPYWTETYKLEYRDSDDLLRLSYFLPANTPASEQTKLLEQYKQEAFTWIRANGGNPNILRFEYKVYE